MPGYYEARFRFYAELNDFLPTQARWTAAVHRFKGFVSVKHLIEAAGVPHTEVDLILANGESVDFSYCVKDGDYISVFPRFSRIDIESLRAVRPPYINPFRFLLDNHLGRLARYMRLLGFDALYDPGLSDDDLASIAHEQGRILLTRDRGLLKRRLVTYGYCIRTRDSKAQLLAVLRRYDLFGQIQPWQRCLRCNGPLLEVSKSAIDHRLEPKTRIYYHDFQRCRDCDRIYWKGSHYGRLQKFIDELLVEGHAASRNLTHSRLQTAT